MADILSEENLSILDELEQFIYLADADTNELLFVNRAALREIGCSDFHGRKCYELMQGRDSVCPFCNNAELREGELFCWDNYNAKLEKTYQLQDKLICSRGRRVRMEVAFDVTDRENQRRELLESRTRYELAVNGAQLAVWEYDIATKRMYLPEANMGGIAAERYGFSARVVENVPECMLPLGLTDADRENFLRLFDEVRAGRDFAAADIWYRVTPESEPRCERVSYYTRRDETGKPVRAYGVGSDVTAEKHEQMKFHQTIQTILAANPEALCTFQINLTKNLCYEGHGASAYILASLQSDTADGLFENAAAMAAGDDDRRRLCETFDRQRLLGDFAGGTWGTHVDYRRLDENGRPFWVRTYVRLLKNPDSGDVEGAIYSLDISREQLQSEIFRIITSQEYDLIALLHLDTGRFEAVFVGDTLPQAYRELLRAPDNGCDFSELCDRAASQWVVSEERESYLAGKSFDTIRARLAYSRRYEFTLREHFPDVPGMEMYRRFQHYALRDDPDTVLVIESDVTESCRRQQREIDAAKAETKRVTDILDSISSGICVLHMPDPEHLTISYVNQQMYRILGLTPADNDVSRGGQGGALVESYTSDAFSGVHPDDLARVKQTFRENFDSTHFVVDNYRTRGADGDFFWLKEEVDLREIRDGCRVFYATYYDVSEEVRLQNELKHRLDREKALRRQAMSASAAKSEFLSRMSHDIRTPLNGIIGMTYFAEKQSNPPETRDCLAKIDTSSKFLLGLVNDILDMSKAESGKIELHPEPYRAKDFFAYLDAVIAPLCRDKNQQLVVEADLLPNVVPLMDALRVNQIFFNLLSNAIKYTPEGGTIRCSIREHLNADDRIELNAEISDNGIGMSEEFQQVLFEPFIQEGRSDISESRGSGLGLAIVKKMVDLMGGTITVRSTVGKGTSFLICADFDWVPETAVEEAAEREALAETPEMLAGRHILLCEDHPLNQEIARALLEEQNALVELADNGQSGAQRFASSPVGYYDAVLMDIRMPVMDGYEATRAIRALARPDALTVPIIAMTADAFSDDVQKCLDAGMNGHIAKPLDPKQMYATILKALRRTGSGN